MTLLLQASYEHTEHKPDIRTSSLDAKVNIYEDTDDDATTRSTGPAGASLVNALSSSVQANVPAAALVGSQDDEPIRSPISEANHTVPYQGELKLLPEQCRCLGC